MDDEKPERSTLLEKRNFHLALSITNGQQLAHISGFSVPSEDVQRHEILDIVTKWLSLHVTGVMDEVHKCTDWIIETTSKVHDFKEEYQENSRMFLASFSIALLAHLIDCGYIEFAPGLETDTDKNIEFIKQMLLGDS